MVLSKALNDKLAKGWALYQKDQINEAFAAFEAVRRAAPHDPQCLKLLGLVAMRRKQPGPAADLFTAALGALPDDTTALNNLGNALRDLGRPDEALARFDRALAVNPAIADLHNNRGNVLLDLGRVADAHAAFDGAIAIRPSYPEAVFNRGAALERLGEHAAALADFERAIALRPDYGKAHADRGRMLLTFGRKAEALGAFSRAVAIDPKQADWHYWRGVGFGGLRRFADALASLDQALAIRPDYYDAVLQRANTLGELIRHDDALLGFAQAITLRPDAAIPWSNRANSLLALKREDEALASCDRALMMAPRQPESHCTRGTVLKSLGRLDEAAVCYQDAIDINPGFAEAWYNLGVVALDRQDIANAQDHFNQAIVIDPTYISARFNLAVVSLLLGDLADGFRAYECRKQVFYPGGEPPLPWPTWLGREDIAGRRIFLHWEQGVGDTIQFARYALLARDRGAQVTLSVQGPLRALMETLHPEITVLSDAERPAGCDFQCALMSLPLAFGTTLETIPMMARYVRADADQVAAWQARLGSRTRPRIGLVWSGNSQHSNDRNRSFALRELAPILACDAEFIALQKDLRPEDAADMALYPALRHCGAWQNDFADTAALIACLDLVISVDTSVAHLAGALGKPTWVMLPPNPDFRWLLQGDTTSWYPSMRLFRPIGHGARAELVARVATSLADSHIIRSSAACGKT